MVVRCALPSISPVLHQLEAFVGIPWNPDSFYRLKMKSCSSLREKWLEGKNWFGWTVLPHVLFGPRASQGLIKPPHLGAGLGCPAQSSPHSYNQGRKPKLGGTSKTRIWLFPLEFDLVTPVKHFLCSAGGAWAGTAAWFHSSSSSTLWSEAKKNNLPPHTGQKSFTEKE